MGSRGGRRNRSDDFSVLHEELSDLTFGLYSAKEIKKLSACLVYNPVAFNQLGHPVAGMYDLQEMNAVSKTHVVMALNLGCPEIQDIEFFLTLSVSGPSGPMKWYAMTTLLSIQNATIYFVQFLRLKSILDLRNYF